MKISNNLMCFLSETRLTLCPNNIIDQSEERFNYSGWDDEGICCPHYELRNRNLIEVTSIFSNNTVRPRPTVLVMWLVCMQVHLGEQRVSEPLAGSAVLLSLRRRADDGVGRSERFWWWRVGLFSAHLLSRESDTPELCCWIWLVLSPTPNRVSGDQLSKLPVPHKLAILATMDEVSLVRTNEYHRYTFHLTKQNASVIQLKTILHTSDVPTFYHGLYFGLFRFVNLYLTVPPDLCHHRLMLSLPGLSVQVGGVIQSGGERQTPHFLNFIKNKVGKKN